MCGFAGISDFNLNFFDMLLFSKVLPASPWAPTFLWYSAMMTKSPQSYTCSAEAYLTRWAALHALLAWHRRVDMIYCERGDGVSHPPFWKYLVKSFWIALLDLDFKFYLGVSMEKTDWVRKELEMWFIGGWGTRIDVTRSEVISFASEKCRIFLESFSSVPRIQSHVRTDLEQFSNIVGGYTQTSRPPLLKK